jgi:hypothetical protein
MPRCEKNQEVSFGVEERALTSRELSSVVASLSPVLRLLLIAFEDRLDLAIVNGQCTVDKVVGYMLKCESPNFKMVDKQIPITTISNNNPRVWIYGINFVLFYAYMCLCNSRSSK